jgi:hypothetical protein
MRAPRSALIDGVFAFHPLFLTLRRTPVEMRHACGYSKAIEAVLINRRQARSTS